MRKYTHYIKGEKEATKYAEHGLIFVLLFCFRWYMHRKESGRNTVEFSKCSVQFTSVAQSCPTLCNPMDRSTTDLPVQHQFLEFTQTHVHWVSDAIQPSQPSSVVSFSSCLQSFSASESFPMRHFFTSGGQSIGVSASASVLPMNTQDWLGWTGWISLQFKGLSSVFSNTTVQKHQFFGAQLSSQSNSHIHTWLLGKPQLWLDRPLLAK